MAFDDFAHRFDRVLQAFAAADEAEGRDDGALADAERRFRGVGVLKRHVGDAVMDDARAVGIDAVDVFQQPASRLGKRDDRSTPVAERACDPQHSLRRDPAERYASSTTTGFCSTRDQIDEPFAAFAAEEPVLVLNVDQIGGIDG